MTEHEEQLVDAAEQYPPLIHHQPGDWLAFLLLGVGIVFGSLPVGVATIYLDTLLLHR